MLPKARLLAVSHGKPGTGYGRVSAELLPRLARDFEVTLFAIDMRNDSANGEFRVLPNKLIGDHFGKMQLSRIISDVDPDVVLLHYDLPFLAVHAEALWRCRQQGRRIVAYCPIEWADTPCGQLRLMRHASIAVFCSAFGRRVGEAAAVGLPEAQRPALATIPHGLDRMAFRRMDRTVARRTCFPGRPGMDRAFIVLNANRATPRKRLDLTLAAFARFAADRPDVLLCLHPGALAPWTGVKEHSARLGICDQVLIPDSGDEAGILSDARLAQLYAACDVGITTTTGESWGLVAFEHAAAGAAQVMPDHSACADLWADAAVLCPLDSAASDSGVVDPVGVAGGLARLHDDPGWRARMSAAALRRVADPSLDWDNVAARWRGLLESDTGET